MVSRVCLEIKVHLENLENQVTWVFLESLELWDKLDQGESEEFPGREESWEQLVCRDLRVSLVHLVQMGQRVAPDPLVHLGMWVLQVFRECQERGVSLVLLGPKVTEAQSVRKDQRVQLETMVPEEPQVLLAHSDPLDPVVRRENLDPKDHLDPQDPEECQDQEVTQAQLVLLDLPDLPVLMANLESREKWENQARKEMQDHQDLKAWLELTDPLGQLVLPD